MNQPMFVAAFAVVLLAAAGCQSNSMASGQIVAERLKAPTIDKAELCKSETLAIGVPKYPAAALRSRTEGWVLVSHDLDGSGRAVNIAQIASNPSGAFEQSTVEVLKETKFVIGAKRTGCKSLVTYALQ